MMQYKLKSLSLLGLLLFSGWLFAQPIAWNEVSPETVVYELTNQEALKLLKGKLRSKHWNKILQTPFTSFSECNSASEAGGCSLCDAGSTDSCRV